MTLENNIRGAISSVRGDRHVKSDYIKTILCIDAKNLYGGAMSESMPYDELKFDRNVILEEFSNTPDYSDIAYVVEVDSRYPNNIK